MNIIRIDKGDICNGDGIRVVVWAAGCHHHCKECHNPETWDFNAGQQYSQDISTFIIEETKKSYYSGITLTGGDPLAPENRTDILDLLIKFKTILPEKTVWAWTGYLFEDLKKECPDILQYIDVLIDGKFEIENYKPSLLWRGSTNQRIIDVPESLKNNSIVLKY